MSCEEPPAAAGRRGPLWLVAVAVTLAAAVPLTLNHQVPRQAIGTARAVAAVRADPTLAPVRADLRRASVDVGAIDSRTTRVSFTDGGQIVAEGVVAANGRVLAAVPYTKVPVPYGNWIAYEPAVLIGLGALFLLATASLPLRNRRNLDVLAALSLLAPAILLQHRLVGASVLAAVPGLGWLLGRCLAVGFGSGPGRTGSAPKPADRALLHVLVPGGTAARIRLLRILFVALGLVLVMVTVSSGDAVDVIYAVMEGATKLIHGVLPYGHLPGDVLHGDTYPILGYAVYAPLAVISPVRDNWASVDLPLAFTALAALIAGWALARTGGRGARTSETEEQGLRMAVAWLAFPPLLITASTGTSDVVLAAMLTVAVMLWRRPVAAIGVLAAAGWFKLTPFALLPVWLAGLRGRALAISVAVVGAISAALLALLVALGGTGGPAAMVHAVSYQLSRGSPQSLWAQLGLGALQPLAQAAVLGLVVAATLAVRRSPQIARDPRRLAALSAAILIGLQIAANYWAFLYVVWLVPLLQVSLLVTDGEPVPVGDSGTPAIARGLVPVGA